MDRMYQLVRQLPVSVPPPTGKFIDLFTDDLIDFSFHFHLCSHAGVGTVNPTFYQVLHDDNNLQLDNLVSMTYALTMDAKRCEKR